MKILKCKKCGNILIKVNDKCDMVTWCGDQMIELKANTVDAAVEKHVPVVNISDKDVSVICGEVLHPMEEEHYIEFMVIETNKGFSVKYLNPGDEPKCSFKLSDDEEFKAAYAYCNLHGLWVSEK